MFEPREVVTAPLDTPLGMRRVASWVEELSASPAPEDDRAKVELIAALERLVCAAQGLQAGASAALDTSVRRGEEAHGTPPERCGRGVAAQVALARRESPHRGRQHLGLARILADEMRCTRRALREGRITEWKATILVRETACLSRADRRAVDQALAGDLDRLEQRGDRELEAAARGMAAELDAAACVQRRRVAEAARRVTLRPVPDTMTRLSVELPVAQGVAVLKSLSDAAAAARAAGDPRTRGQLMCDSLVERVLGTADGVGVEIELVVSDEVLLGADEGSAFVDGYGAIPAELAREIAQRAGSQGLARLRRLYRRPADRQLVAMDSRSRCFPPGLARFIRLRDQTCRTPWCDAPIRHIDHAERATDEGATSAVNGQGLCEACNYAKEAAGWSVRVIGRDPHTIEIRTPGGHVYRSQAPPLVGPAQVPRGAVPRVDLAFSYSAA
jgi:hypothetical protein